ncbi:MAG: alpha/beta hydrolase-fold protein, partial [Candidatus Acidiferrum sp.]
MNKIWRAAAPALLFVFILAAPATRATGRAECVSLHSKILQRAVPYCILLPPSYDAEKNRHYPILYLLHGLGNNDQMLIHSGGMNLIEDLWEQHDLGEFLVVTPSAGASFYINYR